MATRFKEFEKQARALSAREKAALARVLIEDLDPSVDPGAEQLWIDEAQRRYDAFTAGKLDALPGEEVMRRARRRELELSIACVSDDYHVRYHRIAKSASSASRKGRGQNERVAQIACASGDCGATRLPRLAREGRSRRVPVGKD